MQNNQDQMNKTKEIPKVNAKQSAQQNPEVHEDQQSLFDNDGAFSESMLVEKSSIEVNSDEGFSTEKTAVFDIPEKKELSVKELQDTAKDYFEANHKSTVDERASELSELANKGFDELSEDGLAVEKNELVIDDEKKKKRDRKLRRRGVILDDDMEMLSGEMQEKKQEEPVYTGNTAEFDLQSAEMQNRDADSVAQAETTDDGVEHKNPLGLFVGDEQDEEETEDDRLIKALGKNRKHIFVDNMFGDNEPEIEYTDRNQENAILGDLRKNAIFSAVSVAFTLILTLVCLYFELAAGTKLAHPAFFEAGKFGVTYAMSMLQIMFICAMFNLDGLKRAFGSLRPKKSSAEGFSAAAVVVCTLHSILSATLASDSPSLKSFCSIGCMSLLFLSVNSFVKAQTTLSAFCLAASKAPKLSSIDVGQDSDEGEAFKKYLDSDNNTTVFTVGKCDFISGFFKKCMTLPKAMGKTYRIILITLMVAIAAGVVCGFARNVYFGVCTFTTVCLAAFPVNALISTALPFFAASSRAKKTQTAFIGEAACDAYETTGIVSFDDTEVFPAKNVKVSSIRTYGENRIDKVILYMARIFDKVEGPLSFVFSNSVQSLEDRNMEVQITEHFSDGISARIDGKEVLVGTESFMRIYDTETPLDNIDESFVRSLGSIMYMSVDGKLAAKFYIKYTMARSFETLLRAFYDAGICVGIKTFDPCITDEILLGNLKGSNYPVSVIRKKYDTGERGAVAQKNDGAIISLSGVHNFLNAFIRLDNLRNVYRSNAIISTFAAISGAVIAAFLGITGFFEIGVAILVLFQLVWCIPTVLFSVFSK